MSATVTAAPALASDAIETGLAFLCFFRAQGRASKPADLSMAQFRYLAILGKDNERPMAELADDLGVTPPALTKMTDALLERGLVERTPDSDDRRRVAVHPTPAGTRLLRAFRTGLEANLETRLASLDQATRAALAKALPALRLALVEVS